MVLGLLQTTLIFSIFAASSHATSDWRPIKRYAEVEIETANQGGDGIYYQPTDADLIEESYVGYSIGSGLRSIAQGSADKAQSAVVSQRTAGNQAAFVAKNSLAHSAIQAAATAHAALAGKEVLFKNLQSQTDKAHHILEAEISQLELAKKAASNAEESAQHAKNHISVLTAALNSAKLVSEQTKKAADEAAAELASQSAMIGESKSTLKALENQLHAARIDYEGTKQAAEKATLAAQQAQKNVLIAGHEVSNSIAAQEGYHQELDIHQTSNIDLHSKREVKKN